MKPTAYSLLCVSIGVLLAACSSDTGGNGDTCTENCSDADVVADAAVDVGDDAMNTDAGDASPDVGGDVSSDTGPDDADQDPGECPDEARNACGGCEPLASAPGSPCGQCNDGQLQCGGPNSLLCMGAAPPPAWYRDRDGDGYGDASDPGTTQCDSPAAGYVTEGGDCIDTLSTVFPGQTEICDMLDQDCDGVVDEAPSDACTDACCEDGIACAEGTCLIACDGVRCGAELNLCCGAGDICYAGSCANVGETCTFTEECELDEFCEQGSGLCLPRDVLPDCTYEPPTGEFTPTVDCEWNATPELLNPHHEDIVATPIVMNFSDDNGDGVVDHNDIPDIAFLTYDYHVACCNTPATLRIVSGDCNDDGTMTTLASIDLPAMTNDTGIAAGDINADGVPEIVAVGMYEEPNGRPQGTIAFAPTNLSATEWTTVWTNETYPTWNVHTRGGPVLAVANVDGEGAAEVVVGNLVLNGTDGTLMWDGVVTGGADAGVGNNAFLGPASAVGDVDLDGRQEIAAGNSLYDDDGVVLWTTEYVGSNSHCQGGLACDGFNAIGNFDDDEFGEIVAIRAGEAFVFEHTGEIQSRVALPWDGCTNPDNTTIVRNESGPPTVADFDGDGLPEIGTASADFYVVVDTNTCDVDTWADLGCYDRGILWAVPNNDCSSRATGSSVFDFEGDGRAEVVYADEVNFRIFDGPTGNILYDDSTHRSHTRIEMPVIADVDNDGNTEIIIPRNSWGRGSPGLVVFADTEDNWVRTRRVWNQHGYSVTNIQEDGTIPASPEPNWLNPRLNNFRQNTQPDDIFAAPDLAIVALTAAADLCPLTEFTVRVTVSNDGALFVPPGVPVQLSAIADDGSRFALGRVETTRRLFPGDRETIVETIVIPSGAPAPPYELRATVDPDAETNECVEDNNARSELNFDCYE